jgi:hypothetical protein
MNLIKNQNKKITPPLESKKLSNNSIQIFKSNIIKVNDNLFNCQFIINNTEIIIPMRADGYINITRLCKANGKLYADWKRNKNSEATIKALERSLHICRGVFITLFNFHTLL